MPNETLKHNARKYIVILRYLFIALIIAFAVYSSFVANKINSSLKTLEMQLDEMHNLQNQFMGSLNQMLNIASSLNSSSSIRDEMISKSSQMNAIKNAYHAIQKIKKGENFDQELNMINAYALSDECKERLLEIISIAKNKLLSDNEIIINLRNFSKQLSGNITKIANDEELKGHISQELNIFKDVIKVQEIQDVKFKNDIELAIQSMQSDSLDKTISLLQPIALKYKEVNDILQLLQIKANAITLLKHIINQIIGDAN